MIGCLFNSSRKNIPPSLLSDETLLMKTLIYRFLFIFYRIKDVGLVVG